MYTRYDQECHGTALAPLDKKKLNLVAQIIRAAPLIKFTTAAALAA